MYQHDSLDVNRTHNTHIISQNCKNKIQYEMLRLINAREIINYSNYGKRSSFEIVQGCSGSRYRLFEAHCINDKVTFYVNSVPQNSALVLFIYNRAWSSSGETPSLSLPCHSHDEIQIRVEQMVSRVVSSSRNVIIFHTKKKIWLH